MLVYNTCMGLENYSRIILASASPRRKELLKQIVPVFDIVVPDIEENSRFSAPYLKVTDIALQKAAAVNIAEGELLIAADTTVYLDKEYYGKPMNEENALIMLKKLTGKTHTVYTGVCLKTLAKHLLFYEKSYVTFKKLDEKALADYIAAKKPFDKAGAYGIQDDMLVKSYRGSYTNIVGLPMEKLEEAIRRF